MSIRAMKWIVGLDLRPSSHGAIVWARWLAQTSGASGFVGVHVLEEAHLQPALRYHHLSELMDAARAAATKTVNDCQAGDVLGAIEIVQGVHAERSLEAAREYHYADAIIVGRQAPREGRHILRLGRVARRLLRSLDSPVIVVPPDYEPAGAPDTAPGPVVVSTNLREDAIDATRFAVAMAAGMGVPLVVVYVVPYADDYGAHYIPEESRRKIASENQTRGEAELAGWLRGIGVQAAEALVVQGGVADSILRVAETRGASLVVSGSRLLSALERVLLTSIGSELAANAPCPVAVVPPRVRTAVD